MIRLTPVCAIACGLLAVAASDRASAAPKKEAAAAKPAAAGAKPTTTSSLPGGSQATLVATFSDWSAYTAQTGKSKICYALSQPKSRAPANLKDTPAYLFVSFRPADNVRNELASVLSFKTKDGGAATVSVGQLNYDLVTKGENAWVKSQSDEVLAIGGMQKGGTMTVSATSAKGNKTSDKYSLAGFPQALERAKRECP